MLLTPFQTLLGPGLMRIVLKYRFAILFLGHMAVFTLAYWMAFALRFDFHIPKEIYARMSPSLPAVLGIKLAIFLLAGHYHGWWRYVSLADLWALLKATGLSAVALVVVNDYMLNGLIPRAVVVLDALVTVLVLGALRASSRLWREQWTLRRRGNHCRPSLIIGANSWNGTVAQHIHQHPKMAHRVVGFIDNDPYRQGARLGGIPVLGTLADLPRIAAQNHVANILVTAQTLGGQELREVLDLCKSHKLTLKVIPSMLDDMERDGGLPVRDVEINDLLRREAVQLDSEGISAEVAGRTILITGAGGSIGSEICRQLLPFSPRRLILLDNGENCLFLINNELSGNSHGVTIECHLADVRDEATLKRIFQSSRPDVVIHAAAHKHVGLMESNVAACIRNNVLGTKCVADVANACGVKKFVLISTDKAVNPTSVMGVTKHLAERYVHALAQDSKSAFMVVRFGNVLGSNGSVLPIFQEQIRRGGPITVTDERMLRFFMTIPEAAQLVLQAASMGRGGEIFVLEMGEAIPVVELARDLVRLSGLPADAIDIKFVGVRPGEKLFEELYFDDEEQLETSHPKVRAAFHRPCTLADVCDDLRHLNERLDAPAEDLRELLRHLVPEFQLPNREILPPSREFTVKSKVG
jgi:FlaA1/EpsC-like NDP-sugar epimerase